MARYCQFVTFFLLIGLFPVSSFSFAWFKCIAKVLEITCYLNNYFTNNYWRYSERFVDKLPTSCLSKFDHFVGLALKGLIMTKTCLEDYFVVVFFQRLFKFVICSDLKNFAKFTGKHLYQSIFFNKVPGLRTKIWLKQRLWHGYFPMNFAKFL